MTACHSANLPRLRNWLAAQALQWGADVLFWLDSDVGFTSRADGMIDIAPILGLIFSPHPLIGAVVQKRPCVYGEQPKLGWLPIDAQIDKDGNVSGGFNRLTDGMVEVGRVATACMKTDAQLYRDMSEQGLAHRLLLNDKRDHPAASFVHNWFWYDLIESGQIAEDGKTLYVDDGEDFHFCRQVEKLGHRMVIDPHVALVHHEGGMELRYSFWDALGPMLTQAVENAA
jgi:hypothetical protein